MEKLMGQIKRSSVGEEFAFNLLQVTILSSMNDKPKMLFLMQRWWLVIYIQKAP